MGTVRYGPAIAQARAVAAEAFVRAADASRQFKRDEAVMLEDPLTEEEYGELEAGDESDDYKNPRDCEHEDEDGNEGENCPRSSKQHKKHETEDGYETEGEIDTKKKSDRGREIDRAE